MVINAFLIYPCLFTFFSLPSVRPKRCYCRGGRRAYSSRSAAGGGLCGKLLNFIIK